MNKLILNIENQKFIDTNLNSDILFLILKETIFEGIETKELVIKLNQKNDVCPSCQLGLNPKTFITLTN